MLSNNSLIVIDPPAVKADSAVIWLHGLGADGHDFAGIQASLGLPADHAICFLFPHAPLRPVTINGGYVMRAWYDIYAIGPDSPEDQSGLEVSEQYLLDLVAQLGREGIPPQRIVLAGFSQGGAVCLFTALRASQAFAGVLALSTYLPTAQHIQSTISPAGKDTPVWMAHGTWDDVVPFVFGEMSRDRLLTLGVAVDWHSYEMPHTVIAPEIQELAEWLRGRLPAA